MYPWQAFLWQQIAERTQLPHALLLRGTAGIGKQAFAIALAKNLLCSNPIKTQACCTCPSCNWFVEGNHPDYRMICPEDADSTNDTSAEATIASVAKNKKTKKSQISVAQIRALNDYLNLSTHQTNSRRIVIISPAETLNNASANALLKTLEEPPVNTLFLLVSSQSHRLLPTIISRCQALDMALPSRDFAFQWLNEQAVDNAQAYLDYAGGAPLLALQFAKEGEITSNLINILKLGNKLDPFLCAPMFATLGMERAITILQKWIFDINTYKLTQKLHYHTQHTSALQVLANSVNLNLMLNFQKMLNVAKLTASHPLNNQLQLENLLSHYTLIFNRQQKSIN